MDSLRWLTRPKYWSLLLYALLAAALLYSLLTPSIAETILDFLFAGVVPGRSGALAPDTMMMGAAGLTAVLFVIIGLFAVRRWWAVRRVMTYNAEIASETAAAWQRTSRQPLVETAEVVDLETSEPRAPGFLSRTAAQLASRRAVNRATGSVIDFAVMSRLRASLGSLLTFVMLGLRSTGMTLLRWFKIAAAMTARGAAFGGLYLLAGCLNLSQITARNSKVYSRRFWRFSRPYVTCLDSWLEVEYRSLEKWTAKRLAHFEPLDVLREMVHHASDGVRQLFK